MNTALASDLSGAAAALAGLILVFLGATSAAFDSYDAVQQDTVRSRYQGRGGLAFAGFLLSLVSCVLALVAQWCGDQRVVVVSAIVLGIALFVVVLAAWQAYRDIS